MKETKPGQRPDETPRHWWAGKIVTCRKCKCEQELESTDIPHADKTERRLNGKHEVWFKCPTHFPAVPLANQAEWKCGALLYLAMGGQEDVLSTR